MNGMIEVCIDVDGGDSVSWVVARTWSIRRVLELGGVYYSGARASVIFPIEPENFFGDDANAEESCGLPVTMAVAS